MKALLSYSDDDEGSIFVEFVEPATERRNVMNQDGSMSTIMKPTIRRSTETWTYGRDIEKRESLLRQLKSMQR